MHPLDVQKAKKASASEGLCPPGPPPGALPPGPPLGAPPPDPRYSPHAMAHTLFDTFRRLCKALHGQLPQYLAEDSQLLTDISRQSLRSADVLTCATKRTRTRLGDRSFSVAGPCLWNSLPVALRDRDISLVHFKRLLKTLWLV